MQFRVPQNIAMEDRVVGPLTAIQFGILVVGGLISFLIFTSTGPLNPLQQIIGGILGFATVVLAMGKFNGQPMYHFFRFIILFLFSPKMRVWRKTGQQPVLIKPSAVDTKALLKPVSRIVTKTEIAGLAEVVDSRGQYGMLPKPPPKK
jgi:hypothetical protein